MNAIGSSLIIIFGGVTLLGSRRWALLAVMGSVLYLTYAQSTNVAGINLTGLRIIELLALARVIVRGEFHRNWTRVDQAILLLYGFTAITFLLRSSTGVAFIIGWCLEHTLSYFIFRCLIHELDDLRYLLRAFVVLLLPYTILVGIEMLTKQNPFAVIGGLSFVEREGRLRCMGTFRHPSLLGTLGAAFLPLYFGLLCENTGRVRALLGAMLCVSIILLANSGGPVSAAAVGGIGWLLWPWRARMQTVRRSLAFALILMAILMKAPIWYLPAKVSSFSGGDGWHRSYLMDVAFREFNEWWLAGTDLNNTRDWFDYRLAATDTADITNHYLFFGLTAGVVAIALLIWLITQAFRQTGDILRRISDDYASRTGKYLAWGLGCSIGVHMATWLGIVYNFDQTFMIWSLQLAAISSVATNIALEQELNPIGVTVQFDAAPEKL